MSSRIRFFPLCRFETVAFAVSMLAFAATPVQAKIISCAATNLASLQACINTAATAGDTVNKDTVLVKVAPGTYDGNAANQQVRINCRQNLWILGDTAADESAQPRILYQDSKHVYTDLDPVLRNDTTSAGTYGQNNGAVWIHKSDNIRLMGLLVDGNSSTSRTNTSGRIFAYGATLGKTAPVEIRGNVGVNILLSRNVQLRYLSITNAWNGVSILSPNLGGAYSFPDPNDPPEEIVATLPTSKAGLYGNHLVERCRIHDNVFGMLFQRDWDLSSVVRNNLFWGNYLRHWSDPKTPLNYIADLETLDKGVRADGSRRSIAYTTVGGAFLMTDVALTPYRIHNNTFHNNATIFSGYYKTGTQHLFYNNLVGRPYQYFRSAVDLQVQANTAGIFEYGYTQTERASEMLQYMSEHQRSNRVVGQDSIPRTTNVAPNYWGAGGGNFRLYNMRQIRTNTGNWGNGRSWSNDASVQDSVGMTWVPDTAAAGTIASQSDTGGVVRWMRHNMWTGSAKDLNMDPNPNASWAPPWVPRQIRALLGDPAVFRNTGSFDVRWTLGMPLDTVSASTTAAWLKPLATNMKMKGWPTYEGTATDTLAIGAYDDAGKWAAPARRLVLRDTLIETVTDAYVKFRMNVSGEGISSSDITKLEVASAKFYNDVPVSDTLYNQGPVAETPTSTTTRVNSILSSKPWPLPYQFLSTDYNRAGFSVDDSLTKNKLSPDNVFLASVAAGYRLPTDSLYARAEVVLKATLKDGTIVYSNPGVFMFSRPRFQFDVTVLDAVTKEPLPLDADSVSQIAQARQPLLVVIKAKTIKLPVDFQGFANLQMGDAGGLHGSDGKQLEEQDGTLWSVRSPNDTLLDAFQKNATVYDTLRALSSPSNGTLIYRAVFQGSDGTLLPYFIEGRSSPIKVVSGAIYQVTIDSVYRQDSVRILSPSYKLKLVANEKQNGRRDTILTDGTDTSLNMVNVLKGEVLRVVLQVRDRYGNEVRDSSSLVKGLYVNLAHVLATATRYPGVATDLKTIAVDSASTSAWASQNVRLSFDSMGRAYAYVHVSENLVRSALVALHASIVDTLGRELGTIGTRDTGVADTAWLKTQQILTALQWTDSSGADFKSIPSGWVGEWYPVRLKLTKDLKGTTMTGTLPITSMAPVAFYASKGDTNRISVATFANDSLSAVIWVRATDSVTGAWIRGNIDSTEVRASDLNFAYPKVLSSAFYDFNCDGKIDSLVLRMDGPVAYRSASGVVAGDTLDLVFPHQHSSPSAKGVPLRYKLYSDSVMTFAWDPATVGFADNLANKVVVGNPLVAGKTIVYTLKGLRDLAPPIALEAFDGQSWANGQTDSLVVKFSETIDLSNFGTGKALPFAIIRGGTRIAMTNLKLQRTAFAIDSGKYVFLFNGGAGTILPGDSLVIDGTSVSDLAGNLSGTSCPNKAIPITVVPRYVPTQGYVIDIDGDGNADSVHLGFKDSLGSLPETFLVRWGTPAETLTVSKAQLIAQGVKTSDSTITVWTRGWKGQDIFLSIEGSTRIDTIHDAPRTVGPADTTYFEGGLTWEWLADRVPPVVVRARLYWAANLMDTLVVNFSEPVVGCEKGSDPAKCLSSSDVETDLKFSEGSTILSAQGSEWKVLVPRSATSFVPGDSLRGTPASAGGKLADVVSNLSGDASPYVIVLGDPAPPNRGSMMDRNGDGKVDGVLLQYASKPVSSKLPSFTFEWADSTGAKVTLRSDSAYAIDSTHWMAVLSTPGAFPVTGYAPASSQLLGAQQVTMTYRFPVYDSVGAVLKPKALLAASAAKDGYDTIVVWPSEPLDNPTGSRLLEFRRGGVVIAADQVVFKSAVKQADGSWKVVIGPGSPYRPSAGDETRLSTSGSVTDTVTQSNVPHVDHPWVVLSGALRMPYAAAYKDADTDGKIDLAVLDFASPVTPGTVIRVYDPAGTSAYREYEVAASDSGKTHLEFSFASNPWGENVTSLVKSDLGVLQAGKSLDSAVYQGGRFDIADSVPPVIETARLRYTSDTSSVDTLVLKISESTRFDLSKLVVRYRPAGTVSDSGYALRPDPDYAAKYDSAKGTLTIYLTPFPIGYSNPASGDSVRLSWEGVSDALGNHPGAKAKWTKVVANQRVFPPIIQVSNPKVTDVSKTAGDKIDGPQFEIVAREATPENNKNWQHLASGGWTSGESSYSPGADGTVIFIQANVPTTIKLYLYDNMGVFVGTISQFISQEMLDQLPKSPIGMTDVGVLWKGQGADGRLVASGVYPIRLMALREPVAEEKEMGKVGTYIYNRLVNVGVKLRIEK